MTLKVEADGLDTEHEEKRVSRLTPRMLVRANGQLVLPFMEIRYSDSAAGFVVGAWVRIILDMLNVGYLFDIQINC